MKVQLTILLLACLFSQSMAQLPANFAPVGVRWEYNYYNYALEEGRYIHESVGDTIINGLPHRIIKTRAKFRCTEPSCVFGNESRYNLFYTVRNDSLLVLNQNGGYDFAFNFGYRIGDSIDIRTFSSSPLKKGIITRISDTLINNKRLKFWEITQTCIQTGRPTTTPKSKVYELIGTTAWGFYGLRDECAINETGKGLCSFKTTDWAYEPSVCRFSVGTKDLTPLNIAIYPNPVNAELNINYTPDNAKGSLEMRVFDILGKIVFQQKFDVFNDPLSINVSNLAEGMYIISVSVQGKKTYISKFIKR